MSELPPKQPQSKRLRIFRWFRKGRIVVIGVVALLVVLIVSTRWFRELAAPERWEVQAYDIRMRTRGSEAGDPRIAIVGVTDASLNQSALAPDVAESEVIAQMHDSAWPWPRSIHAKVIERLFEAGARVVAIDIVFAAERPEDDELAAVLAKYKDRIVLASVKQDSQGGVAFFRPNSRLLEAMKPADPVGLATVTPDGLDGVVRRFDFRTSELREMAIPDDTQDLRTFGPLAAAKFMGTEVPQGYGELLNYQGVARTYAHLPVHEIFVKKLFEQGSRFEQGKIFQDKLVFYGPFAEVLHDVHNTPFLPMPGVEIHAQLAASILSGKSLEWAPSALSHALTVLMAFGAVAAALWIRNPAFQALTVILLGGAYWFGTQLAFNHARLVFPVVPVFTALFATGAFGITYLFFLEQWEKAQAIKVLNRSVNKRIAKVLLHNEEYDHARRGERRPVAILFSDIRSFTTWSEKAEPEHLVGQLNEYFNRMVELIERPESLGNAQKFIGDAILAAWGDTPENRFGEAEDARRAVAVALQMRPALAELNNFWAERPDRIQISIGMGVNLGDVVVGEVGHPDRIEYTVLGDGVNFAARLESATKQFHTDCLIGEQVEALTREHFIYRHVDYIRVKGKTKPVNVYFLLSDRSVPAPAWLDDYHRARAMYVSRQFTEAAALFREVKSQIGGEDYLCDMYAERCELYAKEPPAPDWDGSYTMTEK